MTGDASFYLGAVADAAKVAVEHREKVVRLVPLGLSVIGVPHAPMRTGRRDMLTKKLKGSRPAKERDKLEPVNTSRKHGIGRNKPCPCGSGLKNKHCKCRG